MTPNQQGFLAMLRWSEVLSQRPLCDPYACVFGFGFTITNFSDHPSLLGTWLGVRLPSGSHTAAAGAYQFEPATWRGLKAVYGIPDFTPASQDQGALCLIRERRAIDDIEAGDIESAIVKCSPEWASLPGSTAGQHLQTFADLTLAYNRGRAAYVGPQSANA